MGCPGLSPPAGVFASRSCRLGPAGLQLREDLREEGGFGVDPQHTPAERVDDVEAAVPEAILGLLHQEGLQRIGDLVAHVRVGQVEAGENYRLQLRFRFHVLAPHQLPDQHVDEHYVRGVDEGHVLQQKRIT